MGRSAIAAFDTATGADSADCVCVDGGVVGVHCALGSCLAIGSACWCSRAELGALVTRRCALSGEAIATAGLHLLHSLLL